MIKKHGKWHCTIVGVLAGMGLGFMFSTWILVWCEGDHGIWYYFAFPMILCAMALSIFNFIVVSQPDNSEQQTSSLTHYP